MRDRRGDLSKAVPILQEPVMGYWSGLRPILWEVGMTMNVSLVGSLSVAAVLSVVAAPLTAAESSPIGPFIVYRSVPRSRRAGCSARMAP